MILLWRWRWRRSLWLVLWLLLRRWRWWLLLLVLIRRRRRWRRIGVDGGRRVTGVALLLLELGIMRMVVLVLGVLLIVREVLLLRRQRPQRGAPPMMDHRRLTLDRHVGRLSLMISVVQHGRRMRRLQRPPTVALHILLLLLFLNIRLLLMNILPPKILRSFRFMRIILYSC